MLTEEPIKHFSSIQEEISPYLRSYNILTAPSCTYTLSWVYRVTASLSRRQTAVLVSLAVQPVTAPLAMVHYPLLPLAH